MGSTGPEDSEIAGAALTPPHDPIEARIRQGLVLRLLAPQGIAQLAHLVAVVSLTIFLADVASAGPLVAWVIAVGLVTAVRAGLTRRALRGGVAFERLRRDMRVVMTALGLAWGLGAGVIIGDVPASHHALIFAVLASLLAGALSTLVSDAGTFRLYLVAMLGPALVGMLRTDYDRLHVTSAFLVLCFAVFMVLISRGAHRGLLESLRTRALLEESERQERRERACLDALIASAPLAVAVLDGNGCVRQVNAQFESLFGYRSTEAVGHRLDALIVPESIRNESGELEARARAGEIVRAEVTRHRRNREPVEVRLSAAAARGAPEGGLLVLYEDITDRKLAEREQVRLIRQLQEALANVKTLKGLLPICASCKKIRNDQGYWSQIEEYLQAHSDADFSHGLCPDCVHRLYGDLAREPGHQDAWDSEGNRN